LRLQISAQEARYAQIRSKFDTSLKSISEQINKQDEKARQQELDNQRLQKAVAELSLRDKQLVATLKTKELEADLLEAKFQQQAQLTLLHEKRAEALEQELMVVRKNETALREAEAMLREQLNGYSAKFEQVQQTLVDSNTMFVNIKTEMARMAEQIEKNKQEKVDLQRKYLEAQELALRLFEERKGDKAIIDEYYRQKDKLANLIRMKEGAIGSKFSQSNPPTLTPTPLPASLPATVPATPALVAALSPSPAVAAVAAVASAPAASPLLGESETNSHMYNIRQPTTITPPSINPAPIKDEKDISPSDDKNLSDEFAPVMEPLISAIMNAKPIVEYHDIEEPLEVLGENSLVESNPEQKDGPQSHQPEKEKPAKGKKEGKRKKKKKVVKS